MPRNEPEYRPRSGTSRDRPASGSTPSGAESGVIGSPGGDITLVVLNPDDLDKVLDKAQGLLDKQAQTQKERQRRERGARDEQMLMNGGSEDMDSITGNGNCKTCNGLC